MIGTISRWGTRGYGFVTCDELDAEAWLHAKFLDDPDYEPRQGDRVEFELEKLADGRYQARRVRPANGARSRTQAGRAAGALSASGHLQPAYGDGPLAVKLTLPLTLPSLAPANGAAAGVRRAALASLPSLPSALERGGATDAAEGPAPAPSPPPAIAAPPSPLPLPRPPPPAADEPLGARLAARRAGRARELELLRAEVAAVQAERARLEARERALAGQVEAHERAVAGDEAEALAGHLAALIDSLEQGFAERRRLREALDVARQHTLQRSGLPTVREYEQLRDRVREADAGGDALTVKAFRALERERRMTLRDLAEAHDRLEAAAPVRARFLAFVPPVEGGGGSTVLVAPLRAAPTAGEAGGALPPEVALRVACCLWEAAERASRELAGADSAAPEPAIAVEHGVVEGALAVRLGPIDPALVQLLLDETWAARPTLSRLEVGHGLEVIEGVAPRFSPDEDPGDEAQADEAGDRAVAPTAGGVAPGGPWLPEAAGRLGLSPRDLVALLCDRGLPFPDDRLDAGTEHTLRALLGEEQTDAAVGDEGAAAAPPAATAPGDDESGPPGARGVASRMLRKLLRDRRVGGRHTRIENAYGHHFSDGEKDLARRIAEWLEKDGIFLPKLNEGSHHISINPRRLRDVGQIIELAWERGAELDAV